MLLWLLGSLFLVVITVLGCADESVPNDLSIRSQVTDLVYQGQNYKFTGVRVGLERLTPKGLALVGAALSPTEPAPSTQGSSSDVGYEVYAIAGVDPRDAIAVKFVAQSLSGADGPYLVWMRYDREK